MSPDHETKCYLFNRYVNVKVLGYRNFVDTTTLCPDGRKRSRVLRELVESGYIDMIGGKHHVNDKIFEEWDSEPFDIFEEWKKSLAVPRLNSDRSPLPYISFEDLSKSQKKFVIDSAKDFEFHLVKHIQSYNSADPEILGPYTIDRAAELFRELFGKNATRPLMLLSNDELRNDVENFTRESRLNHLVEKNFAWGLYDTNILSKEENITKNGSEILHSGGDNNFAFYEAFGDLGKSPVEWEANLTRNISLAEQKIEDISRTLNLLRKAKVGIEELGGMEKFVERLTSRIEEEVFKKKKEAKETAE